MGRSTWAIKVGDRLHVTQRRVRAVFGQAIILSQRLQFIFWGNSFAFR